MTGIGRFLRLFIAFASVARPHYQFYLYGNQHTDTSLDGGNISVRIVPERVTIWWDQFTLPALARSDRIELFLSPYIKGPRRVECPLVTTMHDLMFLVFPEYGGAHQRQKNLLFVTMARWVAKRANLILTDSEYSRRDIVRLLALGDEKVFVLPIGVDDSYRPVEEPHRHAEARRRYGIDGGYIFYLGNFKPHKNVATLLRAFARLDPALRGHQLVLGGRHDAWVPGLIAQAEALGVGERVQFVGEVAEEHMPVLYSGAELFVFPSKYEGFGLPPLEAMACGTAVVCSNRTSLPEVVGDAGLLVDPDDDEAMSVAMTRVLEDRETRVGLERRGLRRAAGFVADQLCARQLDILEAVAAGRLP